MHADADPDPDPLLQIPHHRQRENMQNNVPWIEFMDNAFEANHSKQTGCKS